MPSAAHPDSTQDDRGGSVSVYRRGAGPVKVFSEELTFKRREFLSQGLTRQVVSLVVTSRRRFAEPDERV